MRLKLQLKIKKTWNFNGRTTEDSFRYNWWSKMFCQENWKCTEEFLWKWIWGWNSFGKVKKENT